MKSGSCCQGETAKAKNLSTGSQVYVGSQPPLTRHGRRPVEPGPVLEPETGITIPWCPVASCCSVGGAVACAIMRPVESRRTNRPSLPIRRAPKSLFTPTPSDPFTRVKFANARPESDYVGDSVSKCSFGQTFWFICRVCQKLL